MENGGENDFETQRLRESVSELKAAIFWLGMGFLLLAVLMVVPGLSILTIPFLVIGVPLFLVYRFVRGLAARRARINERLAPRKRYRRGFGGFRRSA